LIRPALVQLYCWIYESVCL